MLTPYRTLRRLLFTTACAWGIGSGTAVAALHSEAVPLSNQVQIVAAMGSGSVVKDDSHVQWMKTQGAAQWAGLSPEQREQLRNQVREHRQRSREEFRRDERRDVYRNPPPEPRDGRQQRMSPNEREEFRQWMRERQGGGRSGRGRGQ